jgi:hypothetical protein
METLMAGAASIEIFLASVGIATIMARLALDGVFWLMQDAGTRAPRQAATPRPRPAIGSLAMVRVRIGEGRHLPLRAR